MSNDSDPPTNPNTPANDAESISPLYEADPKSLSLLFDRIDQKLVKNLPHTITDLEIEDLVTYYISERKRFAHDQTNFIKPERKRSNTSGEKRTLTQAINSTRLVDNF